MHETCAHSSHLAQRNRQSEEDTTKNLYIVMHMETAEKLPVAEASTAARMALIAASTTAITTYCSLWAG